MSSKAPDATPPSSDPDDPGFATLPTEAELEDRARDHFATWGVLDRLAHVEVRWNWRLRTTAGRAYPRKIQIQLNPRLLSGAPQHIDAVLAHEAAHLATVLVDGEGVKPHGPEWTARMTQAGFLADPTHDLPVGDLRPGYFLHLCSVCGARCIRGGSGSSPRPCACDGDAVSVFRAPRTPAGRRALEEFRPVRR